MPQIKPSLSTPQMICAETPAPPTAMVVFGASGDLTQRKLLVSLFKLFVRDLIGDRFYLIGTGRKKLTDTDFRDLAEKSIKNALAPNLSTEKLQQFCSQLYYVSGDYSDIKLYENIRNRLVELDKKYNTDGVKVFYLAVPPVLYEIIVEKLGESQLSCLHDETRLKNVRLVVEKPFGSDLDSAVHLNKKISSCFAESQIYRIDHYLGKETVQNILMFRFANTIFEPFWNRNYIDSVQITIAESLGVGERAGYYEKAGALRDMFQNHMLGMLGLVAMEPPASFDADCVRDEKVKLLKSIRPIRNNYWSTNILRAQYVAGEIEGEQVCGYRQEKDVSADSTTETYVAAKIFVDNWRWKDVPFYLRTGKRLAAKDTEIAIKFKKVPHSMFFGVGLDELPANELILQMQPAEGIALSFQAKRPGSKICMGTLNMSFSYSEVFGAEPPEAYERLLLDCMVGDQMLFTRQDDVEVSWTLLMGVLKMWQEEKTILHQYPAGAQSFAEADHLIESDGRSWRPIAGL